MHQSKTDMLMLENQLCFPLYVASKEIVRKYRPYLNELDLTYTQYITMMVMWEKKRATVKELGEKLFLDSGTLSPLLKNLQEKGLVTRLRSTDDERMVFISLTEKGENLKNKAIIIPQEMGKCIPLDKDEILELRRLLDKILSNVK